MSFRLSLVGVEDTPNGPRVIDSIDGDELTAKITVDGELSFGNGYSGFFGGGNAAYSLEDLIGDRVLGNSVRIELRIIEDTDEPE